MNTGRPVRYGKPTRRKSSKAPIVILLILFILVAGYLVYCVVTEFNLFGIEENYESQVVEQKIEDDFKENEIVQKEEEPLKVEEETEVQNEQPDEEENTDKPQEENLLLKEEEQAVTPEDIKIDNSDLDTQPDIEDNDAGIGEGL